MNHEITCKYCGRDRRSFPTGICCAKYREKERKRKEKIQENVNKLLKILDNNDINNVYVSEYGNISLGQENIIKLTKLLGG